MEFPIHPHEVRMIRTRCNRLPIKPFVIFATYGQLQDLLKGTPVDPEVVKAHSKELKPDFWMFTIASKYTLTTVRKALGLISILPAPTQGSKL